MVGGTWGDGCSALKALVFQWKLVVAGRGGEFLGTPEHGTVVTRVPGALVMRRVTPRHVALPPRQGRAEGMVSRCEHRCCFAVCRLRAGQTPSFLGRRRASGNRLRSRGCLERGAEGCLQPPGLPGSSGQSR